MASSYVLVTGFLKKISFPLLITEIPKAKLAGQIITNTAFQCSLRTKTSAVIPGLSLHFHYLIVSS